MAGLRSHLNAANAITSLSIASGTFAIVMVIRGELLWALLAGALCLPCDVLDGAVARRWQLTSRFGAQLDSLADAISFCLVPAMLGEGLGLDGAATILLIWFVLGGLWRLARFEEVGTSTSNGRVYFQGVPTPMVAAALYPIAAVALMLPAGAQCAVLCGYFGLAPLLLNSSLRVAKQGIHTKVLWVLVPLGLLGLAWQLR